MLDDPSTIVFSLDQAGFGRPIRSYGYSKIGAPLIWKIGKQLYNTTCTACIS